MAQLFGTDGIRGKVGEYPLTKKVIFAIGRTLGIWLKRRHPKKVLRILVGKDTRESGEELELALLNGARFEDIKVLRVGVCPTPTVAYLTHTLKADLGVAISASHNPCTDNGIKFFNYQGYKLSPFNEREIEEAFFALSPVNENLDLTKKDLEEEQNAIPLYTNFAKNSLTGLGLSGMKIVLDCAFGSFSRIAPEVFRELGAQLLVMNNQPDGKNINANCGTLYPQAMVEKILKSKADIGIAFDGDGDRVIVADEKGNILDGDHILAILAECFAEQKKLSGRSVICTQMSNIGLEIYLRGRGIKLTRTKVGDKFVLQEMLKQKATLGGEQSGHIIILERTTTGDGLIVALELVKVMLKAERNLSELAEKIEKFPQVLTNVKVKEKLPFEQIPGFKEKVDEARAELGTEGRLLVRYSGTENLARIMVEGRQSSKIFRVADSLAKLIRDAVGESPFS